MKVINTKMSHKSKKIRGKLGGHIEPIDILEEVENDEGVELSGKMHALSEKPTKFPKKIRSGPRESCRPLHRG